MAKAKIKTLAWDTAATLRDDADIAAYLVPIQVALGKVIRAMGVKEFAAKVKMAGPNVLRAINPRHNPTQDTMNRLLKPFRLKLSLARIEEPRGRRAA